MYICVVCILVLVVNHASDHCFDSARIHLFSFVIMAWDKTLAPIININRHHFRVIPVLFMKKHPSLQV